MNFLRAQLATAGRILVERVNIANAKKEKIDLFGDETFPLY